MFSVYVNNRKSGDYREPSTSLEIDTDMEMITEDEYLSETTKGPEDVKRLRERVKRKKKERLAALSTPEAKRSRLARKRKSALMFDDFNARMKLYKSQHKKRMRERKKIERARSIAKIPLKPDIKKYKFGEKTIKTRKYIAQKMAKGTTFTGSFCFCFFRIALFGLCMLLISQLCVVYLWL